MNPESNQKRIAFGYDRFNGRIVINEGQAAVVKLIYTWYAEGMSLGEIKKTLEGMFVPSPQNKPIWGKQALSNILSNEHYLSLHSLSMALRTSPHQVFGFCLSLV